MREEGLGSGGALKAAVSQLEAEGHHVQSEEIVIREYPRVARKQWRIGSGNGQAPERDNGEDAVAFLAPESPPAASGSVTASIQRRLLAGEILDRKAVAEEYGAHQSIMSYAIKSLRDQGYDVIVGYGKASLRGLASPTVPPKPDWAEGPPTEASVAEGEVPVEEEEETVVDDKGAGDDVEFDDDEELDEVAAIAELLATLPPIGSTPQVTMHTLLDDGAVGIGLRHGKGAWVLRVIAGTSAASLIAVPTTDLG